MERINKQIKRAIKLMRWMRDKNFSMDEIQAQRELIDLLIELKARRRADATEKSKEHYSVG